MPPLPVLRPRQVVAALRRAGFNVHHQTGSHAVLKHASGRRVTVPMHNRDLKTGTLRAIVRESGMSVDEFVALL
jgi:predicted RNA binding protein YcfA (HicA-like mRNA interferase family)